MTTSQQGIDMKHEALPPVTTCPVCGTEIYDLISSDGPARAVDVTPWPRRTNDTYALVPGVGAMNGEHFWRLERTSQGQPPPADVPVYRLHRLSCGKGARS